MGAFKLAAGAQAVRRVRRRLGHRRDPAYVSPIAIVFNLDGIDELKLDPETVAGIFAGTITTWDDPAIVGRPTPDVTLPVHGR